MDIAVSNDDLRNPSVLILSVNDVDALSNGRSFLSLRGRSLSKVSAFWSSAMPAKSS